MASKSNPTETIQIVPTSPPATGNWTPVVGQETLDLLSSLDLPDQESRDRLVSEAAQVLSNCLPPNGSNGTETGLAVGYVQSGKTMSFTNLATLAHDNGYAMVIVIAGTSIPLFKQSEDRLKKDLRLRSRSDRRWKQLSNPGLDKRQHLQSTLAEWQERINSGESAQTILLTVMKNHTHLRNLNSLLSTIDLGNKPVIVIDDEADQAGLNTAVNQAGASATYRQLLELRQRLPYHSFVQYTATPQAPLLINIIDVLSPRFAIVLTPGELYTGGKEFFSGSMPLVRAIPQADIPTKNNSFNAPPDSLQYAMMLFFLGVADAYSRGEPTGNRSMMVHPSHRTVPHSQYTSWVQQTQMLWQKLLEQSEGDRDRAELIEEFRRAFEDLSGTVPDLASFDVLVGKLVRTIRTTIVTEINSKQKDGTPQVEWKNDYSHILVGGQAMDRGFTVEGLTITYMPRGVGVGNADTIQQRARFFGYKRAYLGYCRVFAEDRVRDVLRAYVEHEEDIRNRLAEHQLTGAPLSDWKRAFFLDRRLKPTRKSVLSLAYVQDAFRDEWFIPVAPQDSLDAIEWNRRVVGDFVSKLQFLPNAGHPERTEIQKHLVADNVMLSDMYNKLLPLIRVTYPSDSQRYTGVLLQIEQYLDANPDALCTVYQMSGGKPRKRSAAVLQDRGLFQGANPDNVGSIYPGDRNIRNDTRLTVQIHNLNVEDADGAMTLNVPALAIWVPKAMARDWLSQ